MAEAQQEMEAEQGPIRAIVYAGIYEPENSCRYGAEESVERNALNLLATTTEQYMGTADVQVFIKPGMSAEVVTAMLIKIVDWLQWAGIYDNGGNSPNDGFVCNNGEWPA